MSFFWQRKGTRLSLKRSARRSRLILCTRGGSRRRIYASAAVALWEKKNVNFFLSFLLEVFAPDFRIRSPSDEIKNNRYIYKRERDIRGEKLLFVYTYDEFYERVVVCVVKVGVAVVAKDYY